MNNKFTTGKILLSIALLGQVALADSYKKIVLASFQDENRANTKFEQLKTGIESKISDKKESLDFDLVLRPSGNYHIIALEPFSNSNEAKDVLNILKKDFPTAFINNNAKDYKPTKNTEEVIENKPAEEIEVKEDVKKEIETSVEEKKTTIVPKTKVVLDPYTIEEMISEILITDPEIKERIFQYNSSVEEMNITDGGFYPSVDLIGKVGKVENKDDSIKDKYDTSEVTLKIVQNLFNGFGTQAAVNRDEARAKAAFNKYIEVAQDKMYRAIEAYIKVLRYKEVLEIAKENVKVHEETLVKIEDRYNRGFSTLSEVERVKGRLALSKSNYVSETNNLIDAKFAFHKALGRYVDENRLVTPKFNTELPKTLEHAIDIAIHNNPSVLVANFDIEAIQQSLEYVERNDYPTLDLELQKSRYDNLSGSSSSSREDETSAMLVLNYNLYKGGSHKAEKQKYLSLLNYEYARKNSLKREIIESLGLSWSAYKMIDKQYKYQKEYRDLTAKTKIAYDEEFQLGRRTLIDLLDVQDEVNNIKIKVIHNSYDLLFAKYRISDATGALYKSFGHDFKEEYKKDTLQAYVDQDNDNILDCEDQCDNSKVEKTNIYGCEGITCVEVEEIKFNTELKTNTQQLDTTEVQNLWGVN